MAVSYGTQEVVVSAYCYNITTTCCSYNIHSELCRRAVYIYVILIIILHYTAEGL